MYFCVLLSNNQYVHRLHRLSKVLVNNYQQLNNNQYIRRLHRLSKGLFSAQSVDGFNCRSATAIFRLSTNTFHHTPFNNIEDKSSQNLSHKSKKMHFFLQKNAYSLDTQHHPAGLQMQSGRAKKKQGGENTNLFFIFVMTSNHMEEKSPLPACGIASSLCFGYGGNSAATVVTERDAGLPLHRYYPVQDWYCKSFASSK